MLSYKLIVVTGVDGVAKEVFKVALKDGLYMSLMTSYLGL